MKILFSHLGFSSADVFIEINRRQLIFGTIILKRSKNGDDFEFWPNDYFTEHYVNRWGFIKIENIPTAEQIITEYKRQFDEKGVHINNEILYAG